MNITQLESKAREVCPKWLQDEIDELLKTIKDERESDPDSWGDGWNFFTALDFFGDSDWGSEHRFKLAITKINRHIGVYKKLGKGEESWEWSSTGTKWLKEGDWHFNKQWHDLITECVA